MIIIRQPMKSARNYEDICFGEDMTLYEMLKQHSRSAADIWSKVGLAKEFAKEFPSDDLFWNSEKSMFQIYQDLKEQTKEPKK